MTRNTVCISLAQWALRFPLTVLPRGAEGSPILVFLILWLLMWSCFWQLTSAALAMEFCHPRYSSDVPFFKKIFYVFILLECNCFTVLCWFLLYHSVSQVCGCMCPLPLEPPSHPHPSPLGPQGALSWAPVRYSSFPLAVWCICQCCSPSASPRPLPPVPICPFSTPSNVLPYFLMLMLHSLISSVSTSDLVPSAWLWFTAFSLCRQLRWVQR